MSIVETFSKLNYPKLMKLWSSPTESLISSCYCKYYSGGINEDNLAIMGYYLYIFKGHYQKQKKKKRVFTQLASIEMAKILHFQMCFPHCTKFEIFTKKPAKCYTKNLL